MKPQGAAAPSIRTPPETGVTLPKAEPGWSKDRISYDIVVD
jgi:hypothetical protein